MAATMYVSSDSGGWPTTDAVAESIPKNGTVAAYQLTCMIFRRIVAAN